MKTAIFIILCFLYWIVITLLSAIQVGLEHPGEKRGVSILPGIVVMPILSVGLGLGLNALYLNAGYWAIGVIYAAYFLYGIPDFIRAMAKKSSIK